MLSLILKDILVQKKTFLFMIFYSSFIIIMFNGLNNPTFRETTYIMGSVGIAYLHIMSANGFDDKSKSDIILNSLPVQRKYIVLAKYLSVCVFVAVGLSITGLTGAIIKAVINSGGWHFSVRFINGADFLIAFAGIGLMFSIYYPIYFRFGANYARVLNLVLFMTIFFGPASLIGIIKGKEKPDLIQNLIAPFHSMSGWAIGGSVAIVVLAIMAASLAVSVKVYNNKEF